MSKLLSTSLLALGVMCAMPAYALSDPGFGPPGGTNPPVGQTVSGSKVTTSTSAPWQVKYLGGGHSSNGDGITGTPNTQYDWFGARNHPASFYSNTYLIPPGLDNFSQYWTRGANGWISSSPNSVDKNGYYSYMTTLTDKFSLAPDQKLSFSHLDLTFASDDAMAGIVINGVRYTGFTAQAPNYLGWFPDKEVSLSLSFSDLAKSGITWNLNGSNSVEFIVFNTGVVDDLKTYVIADNPTGLSASVQAYYQINTIPEPEAYAMMLAGLAIVGSVARRRRNMM